MEKDVQKGRRLDGGNLNPLRAQELIRDFIRFRQAAPGGWPGDAYGPEDKAYFDMLEAERIAGRLEVQGEVILP